MPRDVGTGIYHYPDGTMGNSGQTIFSARYNTFLNDLTNTMNLPTPIIAGGTGGSTAADARDNLDAERAGQQVTNYNSHVWEAGSFYSLPGATGSPDALGSYVGTALIYANDQNDVVLTARNILGTLVPPNIQVRIKKAGVWGAWAAEGDATYVNVNGDTMTGNLIIEGTGLTALVLNKKPGIAEGRGVIGYTNGSQRWRMDLGDSFPETGSDAGTNFSLYSYSDAGSLKFVPVSINRANGVVTLDKGVVVNSGGVNVISGSLNLGNGNLSAKGTGVTLSLNTTTVVNGATITASLNGVGRWAMFMMSGAPESGGNTGSDFAIYRYNDGGAQIGPVFSITRSNGAIITHAVHIVLGTLEARGVTQMGAAPFSGLNLVAKVGFAGGGTQYGLGFRPVADTTFPLFFENSVGTSVGGVQTTAAATNYSTSSDAALKEDLKSFDAGSIIDATKVYDFKWKTTGERAYGVLAQQAVEVYPTAVSHVPKLAREDGGEFWGVDYSKYVPVLLQELKALRARVAELENRLEVGATPA